VRILKGIAVGETKRGSEDPPLQKIEKELNAEAKRALSGEKSGEGEGDGVVVEPNPSKLRVNIKHYCMNSYQLSIEFLFTD
jgi:hypothetical protein